MGKEYIRGPYNTKKKRIKKLKMLVLILFLVVSIGYALMSSNISLSGLFNVKSNKFDVHFENISEKNKSKASINIDDNTRVDFNCVFDKPGDKYSFRVDVVNKGTIDAIVDNYTITGLEDYSDYLTYDVRYSNNDVIEHGNLIKSKDNDTLEVIVMFKDGVTSLPENVISVNVSFNVDYIMDDGTGTPHKGYFSSGGHLFQSNIQELYDNYGGTITRLITVNTGIEDTSDSKYVLLSAGNNAYVYGWIEDETIYIGADKKDYYATIDSNAGYYFSGVDSSSFTYNLNYLDLSYLDTSYVTDMTSMFESLALNSDSLTLIGLDNWDVSQVTTMQNMFCGTGEWAFSFIMSDLSSWDVSKVRDMSYMFSDFASYSYDVSIGKIGKWNTSSLVDVDNMFLNSLDGVSSVDLGDLGNWNTSKITSFSYMFAYAFAGASNLYIGDLSKWDTSNVIYMSGMFSNFASSANELSVGDLGKWNVSNVLKFNSMFDNSFLYVNNLSIGDLSKWNVSNAVDMTCMFQYFNCFSDELIDIGDVGKWNVSKVTSFQGTFEGFNSTGLDLSRWNTKSATSKDDFDNESQNIIPPTWYI